MESWRNIEERRKLKKKTDGARSERLKNKARIEYRAKDKRDWIDSVAGEAEDAGQWYQTFLDCT